MDRYEKTEVIEIEARQYFGCGHILSTSNFEDFHKKMDELLQFEQWIADSFPEIEFRYIGANLAFSLENSMFPFQIEPGNWVVKWKDSNIPDFYPPEGYAELLKGFKKV